MPDRPSPSVPPVPDGLRGLRVLPDADALRAHLDALNESGIDPVSVGFDATPMPFLVALNGPYAESEDVILDSPWQTNIEWSNGRTNCAECMGHVHGIEDLRYPVTIVLVPRGPYDPPLATEGNDDA